MSLKEFQDLKGRARDLGISNDIIDAVGLEIDKTLEEQARAAVPSDELTFALWRAEQSRGTVLKDAAAYASEYAPKDWDIKMRKAPTVLSYAQPGLAPRDLMLGIQAFGFARAFPYNQVIESKLVQDRVGPERVLLVVGPDGQSVRSFHVKGSTEFYLAFDGKAAKQTGHGAATPLMVDDAGSKWNFQGRAIEGAQKGTCLERVEIIKDYWVPIPKV